MSFGVNKPSAIRFEKTFGEVLRRTAEGSDFSKEEKVPEKQQEKTLWENKTKYAEESPKITTSSRSVAEQTKAAGISYNNSASIWDNKSHSERYVGGNNLFNFTNTATAGALREPENSSSSRDKKDEKNTFLSAHKSLDDIRYETLGEDNIMSIMGIMLTT